MNRFVQLTRKILLWSVLSLVGLALLLLVLLQLPYVQTRLVHAATSFLSKQTGTELRVGSIAIRFPNSILIQDVFANDLNRDTLLYVEELSVGINMLSLLDNKLEVSQLSLRGVNAHITRSATDSSFNFAFFSKLFASNEPQPTVIDTTPGQPFAFDVSEISLQNIRGSYEDDVLGLKIRGQIGDLNIEPKTINLDTLNFRVHNLKLSETAVWLDIADLKSSTEIDTTTSILPELGAGRVILHNVAFYLNKPNDSLYLLAEVKDLDVRPSVIDLNKQLIAATSLDIKGSRTVLSLIPSPPTPDDTIPSTQNWHVDLAQGNISDNSFVMDIGAQPKQTSGIDYSHLRVNNFAMKGTGLHYDPHKTYGEVSKLQASEQCGLAITQLQTRFVYDDTHAELANLNLRTNHSVVNKYLRVDWKSLDDFTDHPEKLKMDFRFDNTRVSMKDLVLLAPQLAQQSELKNRSVLLNGTVKGTVQTLELNRFSAKADQTLIEASGSINHILTPKKLSFRFPKLLITGTRSDVKTFYPKLPTAINLPEQFLLTGSASGINQLYTADLDLRSSDGAATLKGNVNLESEEYIVSTELNTFNAGQILGIREWLGTISGNVHINGKHFDPKTLEADVEGKLYQTELYRHTYSDISLDIQAAPKNYDVNLLVNDTALKMELKASGSYLQSEIKGSILATASHADFYLMNLSKQRLSGSGEISGTVYPSSLDNLSASLDIQKIKVKRNGKNYKADTLLNLNINHRELAGNNKAVVSIAYKGTTHPESISSTLRKYINQFTNQKDSLPDATSESIAADIQIKPHPILTEVIFPKVTQFSGADISFNYSAKLNTLLATASVPIIEINRTQIKKIALEAKGNDDTLRCVTSVQSCQFGSFSFPKTTLTLRAANNAMGCELLMIDPDSGSRVWIKSLAKRLSTDELSISINHPYIILNNQQWKVDPDNLISILSDRVSVNKLSLEYDQSEVNIHSQDPNRISPLDIKFNQFEIGTLSRLFEKDSAIARGLMNGVVVLQTSPTFGFTSDLTVNQIAVNNIAMGDLRVQATNEGNNNFMAHGTLSGLNNDMVADLEVKPELLKLELDIKQLNVTTVEAFIPKYIRRSEGKIQGRLDMTKQNEDISYSGSFSFSNASFNLSYINNRLYMEDEKIKFDEHGLYFNKFTIRDSMQQPMEITGSILTPKSKPIAYDLKIETDQFRVLNTTAKDNPLYYGTLILNSSIDIKGDEKLPVITAQAKLIEGSYLTVVVQQGELNTDKGDGVVVFTDSSNNTLVADTVQMTSAIRGIDLSVNLEVNNKTRFKLITDKASGDHLQVSGDALLSFAMDPSGKMSLSGSYELSKGNYFVSFQKIVKRDFEIKKGSTIVWSGDPLDAQIDITATYKAKTGATDLLAAELSGMAQAERNAYRKLLNYDVNLMMRGFLLKPQLNFKLDMPPKDQQAFNGLVYAKINYINSDANELNKQVFSLLIMGRFLPVGMSSNTSTTDAVSAVARNSVNQMLSDQMNAISGKYVKGAELNFNLQSNDDYTAQGTQQNTELQIGLKKEMFNNRVSVQVGSNIGVDPNKASTNSQNITGDLIMEYKITEDGRYKFKAFRENNYEGVIDGLIYRTGIGISYTRNFDSLSQLFKAPPVITDTLQSDTLQND